MDAVSQRYSHIENLKTFPEPFRGLVLFMIYYKQFIDIFSSF